MTGGVRLDKWLWAARFYKTRSLATDEVALGRVLVNGQTAKPAREVKVGDTLSIRQGSGAHASVRVVQVLALSDQRGPAAVAQRLYAETLESQQAREALAEQRRFAREPALAIEQGRPTKRDRRELGKARDWQRWSASLD
jgi:ribosome-associated heat shock protein Hsp15